MRAENHPMHFAQALMSWLIDILMLGNAAAMLLSGVLVARYGRLLILLLLGRKSLRQPSGEII